MVEQLEKHESSSTYVFYAAGFTSSPVKSSNAGSWGGSYYAIEECFTDIVCPLLAVSTLGRSDVYEGCSPFDISAGRGPAPPSCVTTPGGVV